MIVKESSWGVGIRHWMVVCGSCQRRSTEAMDMDQKRAVEKAKEKGWAELDLSIMTGTVRHEVLAYRCPECIDAQTIEGRQRSDPNR